MRICRKCRGFIPDDKIACPACTAKKSYAAYRQVQDKYLPFVARDQVELKLSRLEGTWHIIFFGTEELAWCGREIRGPSKRMRVGAPVARNYPSLCEGCRLEIDRAIISLAPAERA